MLHDTILKHKAILDQLWSGLSILGFKKELKKAPPKFEHFFVHSSDEVSPAFVKSLLKPPVTHDAQVKNVMQMLYSFIQNSSVDDVFDFLSFTPGFFIFFFIGTESVKSFSAWCYMIPY